MEAILLPKTVPIPKIQNFFRNDATSRYNIQTCKCQVLKSEELGLTHQVFDKMTTSDSFPWNGLIKTHLGSGELDQVVSIYQEMLSRGVRPDKHTIPRVLAASRRLNSLSFGKQLHGHAVKFGLSSKDYVITALMELYEQLDCLSTVKSLFDNPEVQRSCVPWTLLIRMHMRDGSPRLAIDVFHQMVGLGVVVDTLAVMAVIGACSMIRSLQEGRKVHDIAQSCGLDSDVLVGNSLLKMYLDCGSVEAARKAFDRMQTKDVISWTEMIRGYVKNGGFNEGLKLFKNMLVQGIRPDHLAVSTILPACARMTAHKQGKQIHGFLIRNNFDLNLTLKNALMDMYVKSGFMEPASKIFAQMACKDAVSWTIMIQGYSLHGQGAQGVELFREMQQMGTTKLDQGAYVSVIHACKSVNMVEEGKFYFSFIEEPEVRHYALMVSLLARAGLFDEAKGFIEEKQIAKSPEVLRALLDGCRVHRETEIGQQVIEQLYSLQPLPTNNHIAPPDQLSSRPNMGLSPKKAYSWIEFHNKVHVFGTGDESHPRSERIYQELQCLMKQIVEMEEYTPQEDFSFHDVEEERECPATRHSEMLAISFGLISSQRAAIYITKNLHVCRNCHEMAKAISKLVKREIIVRDPNCFHHFKEGSCSCGDLW